MSTSARPQPADGLTTPKSEIHFMAGDPLRNFVTFTHDRRVIVEGDIYEAAETFWEVVKKVLPPSWVLEVKR